MIQDPNYYFEPDSKFDFGKGSCISIGKFDGVHLGHQKLLESNRQLSKKLDLVSVVIVLFPNPKYFFNSLLNPNDNFQIIMSPEARLVKIKELGLDCVEVIKFDEVLADWSATDFVDFLVNRYNIKMWVAGKDLTFGKNKTGNIDFLKSASIKNNFGVEVCEPLIIDNQVVSSSLISDRKIQGISYNNLL